MEVTTGDLVVSQPSELYSVTGAVDYFEEVRNERTHENEQVFSNECVSIATMRTGPGHADALQEE